MTFSFSAQKMGRGRSDLGKIAINKCRESCIYCVLSSDCVKVLDISPSRGLSPVNYWKYRVRPGPCMTWEFSAQYLEDRKLHWVAAISFGVCSSQIFASASCVEWRLICFSSIFITRNTMISYEYCWVLPVNPGLCQLRTLNNN